MGLLPPSHIDQGIVFGALGIWHLSNTLVSFVKYPNTFTYRTWFPVNTSFWPFTNLPSWCTLRCLELWILLLIIIAFLATQLSHALPDLHHGSIQIQHLQRYQHVTFGLFFLLYALVGLVNESCSRLPLPTGALHAIFALGFLMELLVFHLGHHPGDSLESFVHMLMQIVLACLVSAMLLELLRPRSFLLSVSRCMLLLLKGTWFFHIGLLINYPEAFAPLGCVKDIVDGHFPVCGGSGMELMRAKSIQVLVFGWQMFGIVLVTVVAYAGLVVFHVGAVPKDHYQRLGSLVSPKLDTIQEFEFQSSDEFKRSLSRRRSYKGMATP